jgi:hypothetical protein
MSWYKFSKEFKVQNPNYIRCLGLFKISVIGKEFVMTNNESQVEKKAKNLDEITSEMFPLVISIFWPIAIIAVIAKIFAPLP